MPNLLRAAAVAVAAGAIAAVSVPAAHGATAASTPPALHEGTWAGYYSVTAKSTPPLWASVNFTVPKVSCSKSQGSAPYIGAMWVGIGGIENKGVDPGGQSLLEQTGVGVYCANNKSTTKPYYYPWWEVADTLPEQAFSGKPTVHAGDQIYAQVTSPAESESSSPNEWDFLLIDYTTDQTWTADYKIPPNKHTGKEPYTGATAEVVTEWASGTHCPPGLSGLLCHVTGSGKKLDGFVDLGQVNYTYADYGTADSGLLAIPHGTIEMWVGKHEVVYPTGLKATPGSDAGIDAFSTKYTSDWNRAF